MAIGVPDVHGAVENREALEPGGSRRVDRRLDATVENRERSEQIREAAIGRYELRRGRRNGIGVAKQARPVGAAHERHIRA